MKTVFNIGDVITDGYYKMEITGISDEHYQVEDVTGDSYGDIRIETAHRDFRII